MVAPVNSSAAFRPVELVDIKGKLHADKLTSMVSEHSDASEGPLSVVSSLGSAGCGKRSLLNAIFDAGFDESFSMKSAKEARCTLSVAPASPRIVVVDADSSTGGASDRLVALHAALADVVLMNIWHSDVGRSVPANKAALRTLLTECAKSDKKTVLIFAVHNYDGSSDGDDEAVLMAEVAAIWKSIPGASGGVESAVDVRFHNLPHARYEPEAYASAVSALKDTLLPLATSSAKGAVGDTESLWTDIEARYASNAPGAADLEAAYSVDTTYTKLRSTAAGAIGSWRRTVDRGARVGGFGNSASKLRGKIINAFNAATQGCGEGSRREARREELMVYLDSAVTELHAAQIAALSAETEAAFSAKLLRLLDGTKDAAPIEDEKVKTAMQKAEFAYAAAVAQLAVPAIGLDGAADVDDMSVTLGDLASKFDESPPAKVLRLNKLTLKAQKNRKSPKNPRSFTPGFHLSGMVRQIGSGNLQGFSSYSAGPHSVTMGYQNDRGTPESMAEGDEPFLRLQPKVHFDIDA